MDNVINLDELLTEKETPQVSTEESGAEAIAGENDATIDTDNQSDNETSEVNETLVDSDNKEESNFAEKETESETSQEVANNEEPKEESIQETAKAEYKFKDDFIENAVKYYEQHGTLAPYLQAASVDYDAMDDIDVLKQAFDKENADLSQRVRDKLFEKELKKYNLDEFDDEDEIEIGKEQLKRDANAKRSILKQEQSAFIQSIKQTQEQQEPQISQEEIEARIQESKKVIEQGVGSVIKDNLLKLDANGESFNYQIPSKDKIVDYALNPDKFINSFAKDGSVDWNTWSMIVALKENPQQFIGEILKHGKSLGRKSIEAELKNAEPIIPNKSVVTEASDFDNPFDNPTEFLKQAKFK